MTAAGFALTQQLTPPAPRRALHQRSSRPPILVDTLFDRHQKFGCALHIIDYCTIEVANKGGRIAFGGNQGGSVSRVTNLQPCLTKRRESSTCTSSSRSRPSIPISCCCSSKTFGGRSTPSRSVASQPVEGLAEERLLRFKTVANRSTRCLARIRSS